MISLNSVPKRNKDIAWRIIDSKAVIVPLDGSAREKINICNETATRIWELINGKSSIKKIITMLSLEYNISIQKIEHQVIDVIEEMLNLGLLA